MYSLIRALPLRLLGHSRYHPQRRPSNRTLDGVWRNGG